MKPIRGLTSITSGLRRYLDAHPTSHDWDDFRSFEAGAAYRELIDTLVLAQHRLCAYCEIRLQEGDRQVEHFIPKSKVDAATFAVTNLLAACIGGINRHSQDPMRYLPPIQKNRSCGAFKEDRRPDGIEGAILKPSELPVFPSLFDINQDGAITVVTAACQKSQISAADAAATIEQLNLDCVRLRKARKTVWTEIENRLLLEADEGDDQVYMQVIERLAEEYLSPDETDSLPAFFTTLRCYFGSIGERVLQRDGEVWV